MIRQCHDKFILMLLILGCSSILQQQTNQIKKNNETLKVVISVGTISGTNCCAQRNSQSYSSRKLRWVDPGTWRTMKDTRDFVVFGHYTTCRRYLWIQVKDSGKEHRRTRRTCMRRQFTSENTDCDGERIASTASLLQEACNWLHWFIVCLIFIFIVFVWLYCFVCRVSYSVSFWLHVV